MNSDLVICYFFIFSFVAVCAQARMLWSKEIIIRWSETSNKLIMTSFYTGSTKLILYYYLLILHSWIICLLACFLKHFQTHLEYFCYWLYIWWLNIEFKVTFSYFFLFQTKTLFWFADSKILCLIYNYYCTVTNIFLSLYLSGVYSRCCITIF